MLFFYILLFQLLIILPAFPHCSIQIKESKGAIEEVFILAEKANLFIGRHLLYNRFDFELITQGDLERECYEEQCNIEEAREIFRDSKKTMSFWYEYTLRSPGSKTDGKGAEKIDVIGLLTGLIIIGVLLVILGLLIYYLCQRKCKPRLPGCRGCRSNNSSIVFQRQEEVSLNPVPPCTIGQIGLPTYDQAMALRENYDSPPPPYPGHSGKLKVFKKSLSLPGP
ncbi:transmembrane gamma-carboxyglutamic acid protein 4 isoform X1 [Notechis scutatus]|uniref:Transmembrane gamma-carboxyglutamic acid protein 4 isoform X1 n=1 Tax=Notechis scutatus TaxID=8663 RepID=A0A6J1TPQ4_9SAUR|nr:transmembrane gamma-carboxyglutamic acid protein 4 isoform X1 [Notechis scutatus]XP_026520582.1 transmembrane gamma-carboxyglutamic acid protein 4 isoform X1 [Notechis scutatus]